MADDLSLRLAAFAWLKTTEHTFSEGIPRSILAAGFTHENERIPLVSPQGIFKPKQMRLPLSITTTANGPYQDLVGDDGLISYSYRGTDPQHADNVGLRTAMRERTPLIYFHALSVGRYKAIWPIFITGDNPAALMFTAAADDPAVICDPKLILSEAAPIRRAYVTATVQRRVHQAAFRERVLEAYREHCSLCRLKRRELLDAAHIIPDSEERGEPKVSNGLSMCKIHHAAFDHDILGISPDYVVHIRRDILEEVDGPMLKHGLQEMNGTKLLLPKGEQNWPDREHLNQRFVAFNAA